MQLVHHVTEGGAVTNELYNAAHVFSRMNRKMIAPVDGEGNAQAFALNIKVISGGANTVTLRTASNGYVTKQAVKSWFRVWKKSLTDAGYSMKDLGPYGRVFKPYLDTSTPTILGGPASHTGDWNYSEMVVQPSTDYDSTGSIEAYELADKYTLHLCGESVAQTGEHTNRFTSVGIINSWLGSRKKYAGADNTDNSEVQEDLLFDSDNPLLLARGGSTASQQMLDEVRDMQKDEPPYVDAEQDGLFTQALVQTDANQTGVCDIVAPLGLVKVNTTAACTLIFTLVGIGDM